MSGDADRAWFPPVVARFVGHVESGTVLKTTEFAGAISVTHSNTLRDAGRCCYDSGALLGDGTSATLLFHCRGESGELGIAAFLALAGESVRRIDLVVSKIGPAGVH